jgi:AcrR family transcriptional regulator
MKEGRRTYTLRARAESQQATGRRILDAARAAFLDSPYEEVTLTRVAAAAGVSHQTVLNHFGSKDGLFAAFGEELHAEINELRSRVEPGDARSVVSALMEQYERFGDVNARWEILEERSVQVAAAMSEARGHHLSWLQEQFAAWLDLPARERRQRLALLCVATDVKTWKLLRRHLGHGRQATAALMLQLVEAALMPPVGDGRSQDAEAQLPVRDL